MGNMRLKMNFGNSSIRSRNFKRSRHQTLNALGTLYGKAVPLPESVLRECSGCHKPVWIGPNVLHHMRDHRGPVAVWCDECLPEALRTNGLDEPSGCGQGEQERSGEALRPKAETREAKVRRLAKVLGIHL